MAPDITLSDLQQFTGSETLYRHPLVRRVSYTDGARYLAVHAGAYWLLHEIAFAQAMPSIAREPFQSWTLTVAKDRTATLIADDGNGRVLQRRALHFTDFPLASITLYCCDNVILLPSEY
jgi:hypothetical protein